MYAGESVHVCVSCQPLWLTSLDYTQTAVELAAISIRQANLFAHRIDHIMSECVTTKPSFIATDSDRYGCRNGAESEWEPGYQRPHQRRHSKASRNRCHRSMTG